MEKEPTLLECAHSIIEAVPRLSRLMRQDLRIHSAGLFTEPQFRVMARLYREGHQCLSGLAEYMGVSLPTMSKLIQGLEAREIVGRERDSRDRRRILLGLTAEGMVQYETLLRRTEAHMVDWIHDLDPVQRTNVIDVFNLLDELFGRVELPDCYE
ncbi:MAG: MarR family transcriptional regulator [Anaerolineae bacterium]|nr:MarR family transcriptional regulator [Anaerolineae bacterium]